MKVKNVKLEWYVLRWDSNKKQIVDMNIFYDDFRDELYKEIKNKKINNYNELKERVKRWCMYNYWSRTEYEIGMGPLYPKTEEDIKQYEKIDVWRQLEKNLDIICEYIIKEMQIEF